MLKLPSFVSATLLIALAAPLSAQGVGSLSDGTLAMGEEVSSATGQPAPAATPNDVTSEKIGDWDVQCAKDGPEPRPCRLYQLLRDDSGQPISEVTLFKLPVAEGEAVAGATMVVPLETLLTNQLTLHIDDKGSRRYPFAYCNQAGCIARIGLSQVDINNYKSGSLVKIRIVPAAAPDQVVTVNMSLNGFTKAFAELDGIAN